MTALEARYRAVLRVLPAAYRAVWEEEMVATFLESMATDDPDRAEYLADFGRPSWSEVASVLALAVRLRLGDSAAPPRNRAWGDAVRLVALLGLVAHASMATLGPVNLLWLAGRIPGLTPPPGPWVADALIQCATVLAYVALLSGRLHVARGLAVLGVLPVVVSAGASALAGEPAQLSRWCMVLLDVLLVLALWTLDAPPEARRPWVVALPVGAGVAFGIFLVNQQPWTWWLLDWAALCCAAVVGGALVYLGAVALRRVRPSAPWTLALVLLAAAVLVQRVLAARDRVDAVLPGQRGTVVLVNLGEVVVLLAVAVPLLVLARRELRRLPTTRVAWSEV